MGGRWGGGRRLFEVVVDLRQGAYSNKYGNWNVFDNKMFETDHLRSCFNLCP